MRPTLLLVLFVLAGCAAPRASRLPEAPPLPGPAPVAALPEVPSVDGPLAIDVVHPPAWGAQPDVDSTFVFGSVGTGRARLWLNGAEVPVAPNGAFLTFAPVPPDGRWHLRAEAGGETAEHTLTPAPWPEPEPELQVFDPPVHGYVIAGAASMATGSDIANAAPTPEGDRRWMWPYGTRLQVTGLRDGLYRVRLSDDTDAWIDADAVAIGGGDEHTLRELERSVVLGLAGQGLPFHVDAQSRTLTVTQYGREDPTVAPYARQDSVALWSVSGDTLVAARHATFAGDSLVTTVELPRALWGFDALWLDDGLALQLRWAPPKTGPAPLAGVRVAVDAGHPPGGATGPTRLYEGEANLAIALRLRDRLQALGAEVLMSRTTPEAPLTPLDVGEDLAYRTRWAVEHDADLLVSVHNNAFPDGVNPFQNHGTEVYHYHPFAEELAALLAEEISGVTGIPNLGAKQRSLALVRPSWMPAVLTESLFMMFPQQEAALRDPAFLDRLAEAHARGIVRFVESRRAHLPPREGDE